MKKSLKTLSGFIRNEYLVKEFLDKSGLSEIKIRVNPLLALFGESVLTVINQKIPAKEKIRRIYALLRLINDYSNKAKIESYFEFKNIPEIIKMIKKWQQR